MSTKSDWLALGAGRGLRANHAAQIELVFGLYDPKLASARRTANDLTIRQNIFRALMNVFLNRRLDNHPPSHKFGLGLRLA